MTTTRKPWHQRISPRAERLIERLIAEAEQRRACEEIRIVIVVHPQGRMGCRVQPAQQDFPDGA